MIKIQKEALNFKTYFYVYLELSTNRGLFIKNIIILENYILISIFSYFT